MSIAARTEERLTLAASGRTTIRGSMASPVRRANMQMIDMTGWTLEAMTDVDILQFALTLEHLEAAMYREMLAANVLTGKELQYFQSFGGHEAAHVDGLTQALQALGIEPAMPLADYRFPAFTSRTIILNFAKTAEDLGVGAYQGAAAAIANKDYLAVAGSIVQVEARHAAIINLLLGLDTVPAAVTPSLAVEDVLQVVGPILGM